MSVDTSRLPAINDLLLEVYVVLCQKHSATWQLKSLLEEIDELEPAEDLQ